MGKYSLFKGHDGRYIVANSKKITSNQKQGYVFEGQAIALMTTCDDKIALEEICKNLNCQSPKIKLIDQKKSEKAKVLKVKTARNIEKSKKPKVVSIETVHQRKPTILTQLLEDEDTEKSLDNSGSFYEPTGSQSETEDDVEPKSETMKPSGTIDGILTASDYRSSKSSKNNNYLKEHDNESSLSLNECSDSSVSSVDFNYSFNVPGNSACDDTNLVSKLSKDGRNTKKHLCCYCNKLQTQFARHLILKHPNEDKVIEFIHLPPKSEERLDAIAKIRKEGDFKIFTDASLNKGVIIPARRPASPSKAKAEFFATCANCKGVYTKTNLRHHFAQCTNNEISVKGVLKKARITVGRIHERASEVLRQKVIPCMKEDAVLRCIRYDLLIMLYGNDLCLRHRQPYMHRLIRANLRLCGRFLIYVKELDPKISDFSSLYDPSKYYFLLNAIDTFAGVNESTGHYHKAGKATEIAKHINKIGDIYIGECIFNKEPDKQKQISDFLSLCKKGFSTVTNKTANETLVARQREKTVKIPSTVDIMRLCQYLDKLISTNYESLKNKFSYSAWRQLAETVLTRVQVFNRRRAGEAERLYISDFNRVQTIKKDDEDFQNLSEEERKAANEYVRVELRGKLNGCVPILLTRRWQNALKLILNHRKKAGVSSKNLYVFGIDGKTDQSFLSATALMRRFSEECSAEKPKTLRGTQLRKHVATRCSQFGFEKTETAHIAKFMGHDIRIHENIYKQPVAKTDILGISRVLEKAQQVQDDSAIPNKSIDSSSDINVSNEVSASNDIDLNISMNTDSVNTSLMDTDISGSENLLAENKSPKIRRIRWTDNEMKSVEKHFSEYIKSNTFPTLPKIRSIQRNYNVLTNRTTEQIKAQINNIIKAKKK